MSKSASCVDWFVFVNALTCGLKLSRCVCLKIKFFAAIMLLLVRSVIGFLLRECSPLSLEILAARITYAVVRRILVNLENLL